MDAALPVAAGVATDLGSEVVASPLGFLSASASGVEELYSSMCFEAFAPLVMAPVAAITFLSLPRVVVWSAICSLVRLHHYFLAFAILSLFATQYFRWYSLRRPLFADLYFLWYSL